MKIKCKECEFLKAVGGNGSPGRCYCMHSERPKGLAGTELVICNTERHTNKVLIKTAPRWCPRRSNE